MRYLYLIIFTAILFLSMPILSGEIENAVNIIEDETHVFEANALTMEGKMFAPIRSFENIGAEVSWNETSNTVTCNVENAELKIPVDSDVALVNGIPKTIDVSATIVGDTVYVPIRFVGETLGCLVEFDYQTETISVSKEEGKLLFTSEPNIIKTFQGSASWYGNQFHGKNTASGETFNENAYTAAHRNLPFGTKVNVTYLKTGKSVIVKINDRGPHTKNRIIDLSKAAAEEIGLRSAGIGKVKLEVLEY